MRVSSSEGSVPKWEDKEKEKQYKEDNDEKKFKNAEEMKEKLKTED